ncbi:MAG: caspase family protein [Candidatus Aminicenantes bacterium]|nr:caspase family protein [Candidatus Aminicenantes bacterium]
MVQKAFCVGINDYPYEGSDLNGCVNDAYDWAELLRKHFDFPSSDVKLITDSDATKKNIMDGLKTLLSGSGAGDVLVFTNSSHGTYIADTSGDEERYDEALCPYDVAENLVTDDELRELFLNLPEGVHMTVISDSCHSGTVTRAAIGDIIPGFRTPDHRRVRFLNPALRGENILYNPWKARTGKEGKYPESKMKEILLSGCKDSEYSYDALIEGKYHGAMTYFAINAIVAANYKITYAQLVERVNYLLEEAAYPQHPQLEGNKENKKRQMFT